ncbi:Fanconi anemia group I -like protein [Trichinella britovi]|uniref:Fanconi anemia group I-like protein n=1 Tax=Trichinella britovi TaxID=45882 RepID=A0A0V1CW14_TRIBR|nr:Fanconi anemia group I -like protein [Trichinella britovi]
MFAGKLFHRLLYTRMSLGKLRCAICYRKCISISALLENHGAAQTDVNKQNTSVLPHWVNTQNSMKIYEAKSMNELWEIFDEKELSSGELVSFLNCLCKLSINGTEIDEFKRRSDVICQKIFNRLNQFKSGDFIIIFRCLLKLNVSPEHKIIQILEQQLLRCLHLLSVSSLISLVCFHFPFATSDESKIFQRELEMALFDKIDSITSFFSLLELWTVYGTDYNWKTALQCKMLKLTGEASLDELLKMLLHLADRSIRIPKVIDSNLLRIYNLQKENGLNLNQAISVLNSMMKLNYLKIDLVNAACDVLKDNILNLDNVNSINEIAYIFGSMKLRDESILNLLCEWFTTRLNSLAVSDLFQLVITLAQCNFENSICNKISNYLENADGRNSNAWLNVVWSLSIQRNLSSKLASTVLNSSFASKFKDDLLATLKLVNVKSAVQLEVDDYAGPEFKFNLPESCRYEMIMNRQKIDMAQILFDALNNLVPLHKYVKYQFIHQLGYAVEAELRYDLKNGIISLEDWKRSEDVCKKILLILLDQRDFTKISSKLIGRRAMMIRHFKLSGYSIATIHWSKFGQLKNKLDRIKFLNSFIVQKYLKSEQTKLIKLCNFLTYHMTPFKLESNLRYISGKILHLYCISLVNKLIYEIMSEEKFQLLKQPWLLNSVNISHLMPVMLEEEIAKAVELTMVEKPECLSRNTAVSYVSELNCLGDSEKFKALILWLVKRMKDGQLPDVALSSIYIVLLNELSNLEICYVVAMTSRHMEHFQRGNFVENKWAFLLPKVFSIIAAATEIDVGDGNRLPGKELKTRLLQQFANLNLPTSRRLLLLTVLKEVEMTPSEKVNIFKPFFDHLNELNLDEIECYVNGLLHLLVMESKNVFFGQLMEFLCSFPNRAKYFSQGTESVQKVQSNVILNITHAVRQYQSFGKHMKTNVGISEFYILLPLCLTRIHRYHQTVCLELLKMGIFDFLKKKHATFTSAWLRSVIPENDKLKKVMDSLISSDLNDREYVVHGLSELGFLLLDSVNLKEGGTLEKSTKNVLQNEQIALAKHLIIGNFKRHNFIRRAIIEKIIDAVMLQSSSCLYLLDVFCILIKISPMTVLESEETIIKSFSVLPVLSTESGLRYMKSLIPIIELKPAMRNSLFIALRNAIFSKDLLARKTAVNGFLLFLNQKDLINAFSSSQMSNSSQPFPTYSSQTLPSSSCAASGRISVATIFLEMISCLRRALSLQSELRRMLYIGLCKVAGNQKVLQEPVLDMLQKQFENYLSDPSKSGPPLCLEFCISSSKNGVTLIEPLGVLIASINLCLGAVQADDTGNDSEISSQYHLDFEMIDSIKKRMNTICQYMMSADLEDFNLDKSVSFSTEEIVGQRTISMAFQFLSVLEALIDFIIMDFNFNSADSAISILKLYGLHCKMSELLKENLNLKRHKRKLSDEDANSLADVHGRKGKLLSNHECCIRLSSLAVLLSHLLTDLESDHEVSLNPMREREDFMTFLFNAVKSKLTNVQIQEFNKRKDSVSVCKLARSLFLMFFRQGNNVAAEVKKYPSLVFSSLEAFSLCIDVIDNYSTSAESFAKSLSLMVSDFDASLHWNSLHHLDQIYRYCVTFTKMLRRNLNTSTDDKKDSENKVEKASAFIIRTIEKFLAYLPRDCSFYEKVFKHIWQICEEQIDMEPYVARLVWNLALSMFKEVEAKPTSLIHIAEQLHCIFGDIADGHITDESEYRYSSINARTASTVLGALLNIQDLFLEDVIYAIGHAKALRFAGAAGSAADSREANLKLVETSACEFLGLLLLVWHELVQSRIPVKMIDSVIKGLEKMFKVLHLFAKYHVTMVLKKYSTPNELFQQLTKRSGTHLIPYVYKMISYAQEESNSSGGKSRTSGAKAKVKIIREMRSVSKLIFALENYEQCLIDLGNRCNVNYMRTIKPSVNRDFKIDVNRARAAIRDEHEEDQQQDELENVVVKKSRKG